MKYLSKKDYLEKMRGCWMGKAIGGTMGAVFEAKRGAFDLEYYTVDVSNGMIPNDDLDLQLVWLNAAEFYKTELTAEKLTDYWLLGIIPNWAEYGVAKANMRMGLNAPACGKYKNHYRNSNGAWIRSEIWACIAPGHPEVAVKYAMEDALTDHADEGVYAEVFMAALQSAAFVESDKYKLIDIALSYIPTDCGCARAVRRVIELYESGIDWKATRVKLLTEFPDSFANGKMFADAVYDVPNGEWGYDAPSNIAITLIGWLYAGDDFGKAICITAGCGEDGDCTTGALGSLLGILMGESGIPEKWKAPIGNDIKTICINLFTDQYSIPKTMDELVVRTMNLVPAFLNKYVDICTDDRFVEVLEGDELYDTAFYTEAENAALKLHYFRDMIDTGYVYRGSSRFLDVKILACDGIEASAGNVLNFKVKLENRAKVGMAFHVNMRFFTPDGMSIEGGNEYSVFTNHRHWGTSFNTHDIKLVVESINKPMEAVVCEASIAGLASKVYVPITLIHSKQ